MKLSRLFLVGLVFYRVKGGTGSRSAGLSETG